MIYRSTTILAAVFVICTGFRAFAVNYLSPTEESYDTNAVSSAWLNMINSLNQNGKAAISPDPVCKECATRIETHANCTPQNSYLENDVQKSLTTNPIIQKAVNMSTKDDMIRPACIQAAMETYGAGRAYHQCSDGHGDARKTTGQVKPCVSENYLTLTSKSFNAVAHCLSGYVAGSENSMNKKITSMAIFSLLNVESGFHMGAMSPTGAGGPGQLVSGAIETINNNLGDVERYLSASSDPLCSDTLIKALQPPMKSSAGNSCERISASGNNPLRNFIYTFVYQSLMHQKFANYFKGPPYQQIISNLPQGEQERIVAGITSWAHNTGPGGMQVPLESLLADYRHTPLKNDNDVTKFLNSLQRKMITNPHRANSSEARKHETFNYYSSILARTHVIETHINGDISKCYNE